MSQHRTFADRQPYRSTEQRRRGARYVTVGEKEFYDPAKPADRVEYQIVSSYRQR